MSLKNKTIILCLLIGIIFISIGCLGKYPEADSLVLTVDDSQVYMDEMMYHIMLEKLQGDLYASLLGMETKEFWEMKPDNGKTMRETAKEQALKNAIKYEVLYQKAGQEGYKLTEEDEKASLEKVESIIKNVPEEQLSDYGLSKEKLIEIQEKIAIVTNYYNDNIDSFSDEERYEELKDEYDITIHTKVWKEVVIED